VEHEAEIVQFFDDYAADFSRLGIQTILHYFHRPCMVIAPQGVFTLISDIEVEQLFEPMFENLKLRGYTRSDWIEMQIKFLNDNVALASSVAVYYDAGSSELERTGGTYALHKTDRGWKIAVIIVHSPNMLLHLD
jgi:hypothetical protein